MALENECPKIPSETVARENADSNNSELAAEHGSPGGVTTHIRYCAACGESKRTYEIRPYNWSYPADICSECLKRDSMSTAITEMTPEEYEGRITFSADSCRITPPCALCGGPTVNVRTWYEPFSKKTHFTPLCSTCLDLYLNSDVPPVRLPQADIEWNNFAVGIAKISTRWHFE